MSNFQFKIMGARALKKAIERNPRKVSSEVRKFIQRANAIYRRGITNNPWRIGGSGGGAPVDQGYLVQHRYDVTDMQSKIYPTVDYAKHVHYGTGRMEARPWLSYIFKDKMSEVEKLQGDLIKIITRDLAK